MKWIEIKPEKRKNKIYGVETYVESALEDKLRDMKIRKESIEKRNELIYTDKRDGVIPGYNIRFDRFDAGLEACEKYGAYKAQEVTKGQNAPGGEFTDPDQSETGISQ